MLKAIFLDVASLYPADLNLDGLKEVAEWRFLDNFDAGKVKLSGSASKHENIFDAEVLVSNKVKLDRPFIERCTNLKLICVAATGINNIDLEVAREYGIAVCNVRSYATPSVTQHVFSLILSLNRKLNDYHSDVRKGKWSGSDFFCYYNAPLSELQSKTLGIIGYGELGQAVAKVADCFGMRVIIAKRDKADTRKGRVGLTDLLSSADVVSLHCPLTENNDQMISVGELTLMKKDALLINTARGGLIDENALLNALKRNEIGGAALDVLKDEPPALDNPLLNYRADNLIITPHVAWASSESRQRLVDEIAENIQAFRRGESRNLV